MSLDILNKLADSELADSLSICCGSTTWVQEMMFCRPFTEESIFSNSERIWWQLKKSDWLEAFSKHPKIGDLNLCDLEKKFAKTANLAKNEQSSIKQASQQTLLNLKEANEIYEKQFGYIFIVCATGKTAEEMYKILETRLKNNPNDEIKIAASEQAKITKLRLEKLINLERICL